MPYLYLPAGGVAVIAVLTSLLFTGCAGQPALEPLDAPQASPAQTYSWECERNFAFLAREEGDAIWLFLPAHAVQLPRVKEGSGANYRGRDIRFHHQNGQARLELPDSRYDHCRNNAQRAARENARLNGADFRATGTTPEWSLEIFLDGDMHLMMDAGDTDYHFVTPEPLVIESERKTLYSTQNRRHQIIVELVDTPCTIAEGTDMDEVTVNISIDDRRLQGCGSALH